MNNANFVQLYLYTNYHGDIKWNINLIHNEKMIVVKFLFAQDNSVTFPKHYSFSGLSESIAMGALPFLIEIFQNILFSKKIIDSTRLFFLKEPI